MIFTDRYLHDNWEANRSDTRDDTSRIIPHFDWDEHKNLWDRHKAAKLAAEIALAGYLETLKG